MPQIEPGFRGEFETLDGHECSREIPYFPPSSFNRRLESEVSMRSCTLVHYNSSDLRLGGLKSFISPARLD